MPIVLPSWRSAKADLIAEAEAKLRANYVKNLALHGLAPGWALSTKPLPGFLEPFVKDIIQLKYFQAIELLNLVEEKLNEKARYYGDTALAELMTIETLYYIHGNDQQSLKYAKNLLYTLVDADKDECTKQLDNCFKYIQNHPVKDRALARSLLEGPWQNNQCQPRRKRSPSPRMKERFTHSGNATVKRQRYSQSSVNYDLPTTSTRTRRNSRSTNQHRRRGRRSYHSRADPHQTRPLRLSSDEKALI